MGQGSSQAGWQRDHSERLACPRILQEQSVIRLSKIPSCLENSWYSDQGINPDSKGVITRAYLQSRWSREHQAYDVQWRKDCTIQMPWWNVMPAELVKARQVRVSAKGREYPKFSAIPADSKGVIIDEANTLTPSATIEWCFSVQCRLPASGCGRLQARGRASVLAHSSCACRRRLLHAMITTATVDGGACA